MRFVPVPTMADMNVFHPTRYASVAEDSGRNLSTTERPQKPLYNLGFQYKLHLDICIFSSGADGTKIQAELQIWCAESLEGGKIRNQMGSHR